MNDKQLEKLLHKYSKLNGEAHSLRAKLSAFCMDKYGYDPADVDFDEFIDSCEANGAGGLMTAKEFHDGMIDHGKSGRRN